MGLEDYMGKAPLHKDIYQRIKKAHDQKDMGKRVDAIGKISREYHLKRRWIDHEIDSGLEAKVNFTKKELTSAEAKLEKEYKAKVAAGAEIEAHEAEEHLKALVGVLMVDMGYAPKGMDKEEVHDHFQSYLRDLQNTEEGGQMISELYGAIGRGDGRKASKTIVNIIKYQAKQKYHGRVDRAIHRKEDHDFVEAYVKAITGEAKKATGKPIDIHKVRKDYETVARTVAAGQGLATTYQSLLDKYQKKKKVA